MCFFCGAFLFLGFGLDCSLGKIWLFPVLNFYTHDEWKMKWKVILLRNLMRSKISECYFYQTLSILVPLKCPLKKKIILIFQATIVSIGGFKGSKNISFPIDSSMSNPEFRAGLVINGPYTEAWLVSPEGNTWNKERKQDRFQDLWSRSFYFEWWVVYAESKGAKGGQTDRQTLIL